ncbi:DNA replication/repair protein RecF [bacterium]|nr:DNA replication/repair protein RecF [bacterium]
MQLNHISITNIRNIKELSIECSKGVTVFTGNNGQGKTNILEAIFLLAHARSFRNAQNEHLISFGQEYGSVEGELKRKEHEIPLRVVIQKRERTAFLYGKKCSKLSELAGHVHFVTFDVTDMQTLNTSPAQRRNMLNKIVFNLSPGYLQQLRSYEKTLTQRNVLLNALKSGKGSLDELEAWNSQLVHTGLPVYRARHETVTLINSLFSTIYSSMIDIEENPRICYKISLYGEQGHHDPEHGLSDLKELYAQRLKKITQREIERGHTLLGPHRDDFSIFFQQNDMRFVRSQGEQRTAIIALKLTEIELFKRKYAESPIILFDDIFSELDDTRMKQLMYFFDKDYQIFLSCVRRENMQEITGQTVFYEVNQGLVRRLHEERI